MSLERNCVPAVFILKWKGEMQKMDKKSGGRRMEYTLMHKDIPVMGLEIDSETCAVQKILEIYAPGHIPPGTLGYDKKPDRSLLNKWWMGRSIPMSRSGIREALEIMDVSLPQELVEKSLGLSLSDQYWMHPKGQDIRWLDVNFFRNDFSGDVGNALFGNKPESARLDFMSPDNTSDGCLKKKWKIIGGKRCLVKAGTGQGQQEPFNEVLASKIMKQIGTIDYVPYSLIWENDMPYSVCADFINEDTELITAASIMRVKKKPNHQSDYGHFMECCETLGIPGYEDGINKMLAIDFLIANEDRHLNNFGAVRNAETLEWLGLAPVFDCGTSMWCSQPTSRINTESADTPSKPFRKTHAEQVKLVTSFGWLKPERLAGIDGLCDEVFRQNIYMDVYRREKLCRAAMARAELLLEISHGISRNPQSTDEMKLL